MEEITETNEENIAQPNTTSMGSEVKNTNNSNAIAGAILVAGVFIAGAILLKGNSARVVVPSTTTGNNPPTAVTVASVTKDDRMLGDTNAKITLVMYEDFQCPFCGRFHKETETAIRQTYVADGRVKFVYRDYAFLGPESTTSAEAARCAGDQGKFWEYHDYLFEHQNGENQGNFNDTNLVSYASVLGLNKDTFNQCLTTGKYAQAVADSTTEGNSAGVRGTPKGFILKNGKVIDTIDGAIPAATVKAKIDAALK